MKDASPEMMSLFHGALERLSAEERAAYLAAACGQDAGLRERIEALLRAHEQADGFLPEKSEPSDPRATADERSTTEHPGVVLAGRYKLVEEISEGGMGTVWMAQQTEPVKRLVAVKLIKAGMDSRQVLARFEAERQALALMDHPNIAKVLDAGETTSGRPFFMMELVKGVPITKYCDDHRLTPRQRLELFVPVCSAIQHAHQKGIIHRDVKPSNVLVAQYDDKPVPKVIDFGVAKATGQQLTERTLHTGFGAVVGTLEYMSPEQANFNQLDVDTRSDVYSLGVLLYELLTGSPPFSSKGLEKAGMLEMLRVIREQEPSKPSTKLSTADGLPTLAANRGTEPKRLAALVRGELDWIVMKALEKDRSRRYETANAFALDVQRYLTDEPVLACPPSVGYRLRKFVRRNRATVLTAVVVATALVTGTVVSVWQAVRATRAEGLAEERFVAGEGERKRAVKAERQALERLCQSRLAEARAGRRTGLVGQREESLQAIQEAVELTRKLDLDRSVWMDLRHEAIACLGLTDLRLLRSWEGWSPEYGHSLAFDPELQHWARGHLQTGQITVHRVGDDREVARMPGPQGKTERLYLHFSPAGDLLCWLTRTRLEVWDWQRQRLVWRSPYGEPFDGAVAFHPGNGQLAVARRNRTVCTVDLRTGKEVRQLELQPQAGRSFAYSPDGGRLAIAQARKVEVFDLSSGEPVGQLNATATSRAAWHPDGRLLAVPSGYDVRVWNSVTGKDQGILRGHQGSVVGVKFSADGQRLCSWSWDGTTRLWDVWSGRELVRLHGGYTELSRDGRKLVCRRGSQLLLYEITGGPEYSSMPCREEMGVTLDSNSPTLSPDGRWLALAGRDVRLVDLAQRRLAAVLPLGRMHAVRFHPSGRELFTTNPQTDTYRWPLNLRGEVLEVGPPTRLGRKANNVALDAKGKVLALSDSEGAVVLDLDNPEGKPRVLAHPQAAHCVAVSPDGRWVATGTFHGYGAKVWDAASGKLIRVLFEDRVHTAVAFSPDGRQLVTSNQLAQTFWDTQTWGETRRNPINGTIGGTVAWDARGQLFVCASLAHWRVVLQEAASGRILATLEAPDDLPVDKYILTHEGDKLLLTGDNWKHVSMWDLRLLRQRLADLGLDWDAPAYPPAEPIPPPVRIEVELVNPLEKATRAKETQGNQHRARQEYAQAIACYREVVKHEPYNASVLGTLAWLLAIGPPDVRSVQDALLFSDRATLLMPDNGNLLVVRSAAQYRAGQTDAALRSLRRAEELLKNDKTFPWPRLWLVQALCQVQLGQYEEARAAHDKALEWLQNPRNKPVHRHDAKLLQAEVAALLKEKNDRK